MHKFNLMFPDDEFAQLADVANSRSYTVQNPRRVSIADVIREYVRAGLKHDHAGVARHKKKG